VQSSLHRTENKKNGSTSAEPKLVYVGGVACWAG